MADAFVGEIRMFTYNYVPRGWILCDGRTLQVREYNVLYAVITNTYGGDNVTFNLPNLTGRAAVGVGTAPGGIARVLGKAYGSENVTLTTAELPPHTHQFVRPGGGKAYADKFSDPRANSALGSLALVGGATAAGLSTVGDPNTTLHTATLSSVGGGKPHENRQPFQVVTFAICNDGEYPVPS